MSKFCILSIFTVAIVCVFISVFSLKNIAQLSNWLLYLTIFCGFYLFCRLTYFKRAFRIAASALLIPISIYFSLNFIESTLQEHLLTKNYYYSSNIVPAILHSLCYYLPSFLLMMIIKIELLDYNQSNQTKVPNIILLFMQVIIFFLPALFVLSNVFSVNLTGILATSGVLTIIVGLAIQPNLSNILSGLFVNLENPFAPEDWVTIDNELGQVIDISWRSTRIRTFQNTEVTIPNEIVAKSIITNWNRPDKERMSEGFHIYVTLLFHPNHEPEYISQLLYDSLKKVKPVDGRTSLDRQWVRFIDVEQNGLKFWVSFDCTNRLLKNSQENAVLMEIHKTMRHAGVTLTPGRLTTLLQEDVGLDALKYASRKSDDFSPYILGKANPYNEAIKNQVLLRKVSIFNYMKEDDIKLISETCERKSFKENEYIVRQNDNDQSLFVIADGVVSVQIIIENGDVSEIDRLGVGDFFGEMSLMTGEPRTADIIALRPTLVLEVKKDIMQIVISDNQVFSEKISTILAEREIELSNAKLSPIEKITELEKLSSKIKMAILKFFN